ncbi:hypothetical protein [Flavobacterium agri]|nr:hypothetical protein [Flavobacterium agri]
MPAEKPQKTVRIFIQKPTFGIKTDPENESKNAFERVFGLLVD